MVPINFFCYHLQALLKSNHYAIVICTIYYYIKFVVFVAPLVLQYSIFLEGLFKSNHNIRQEFF